IIANSNKKALKLYKKIKFNIVLISSFSSSSNFFKIVKNIRKIDKQQIFMLFCDLKNKKDLIKAIKLRIRYFIWLPLKKEEILKTFDSCLQRIENKNEIKYVNSILEQYKLAVDNSTILSKTNKSGIITYANEQFCKISKYNLNELIGKQHNILRHPDMPKSLFKNMWQRIKIEKKIWKGIIKNRAKDGSSYVVNATIIPILDEDNQVVEYLAIRHDITELEEYKKLLEDELTSTAKGLKEKVHLIKEFEKAFDISTSFTRTDTKGIITYVNGTFCDTSGFTKEELVGNTFKCVRNEEVPSIIYERMWKDLKNKKTWRGILKNKTKNNENYFMDTTIIPILNTNNEIVEYISIKHNISEVVNLNEEIINTQKEVIFTMGSICESRSNETGSHVQRVANYSYLLATLYGLPQRDCELLKYASPVHDIGKIAIADNILQKPGKLTAEEFEKMKEHASIGYNMLKNSNRDILKAAATIAHEHHERWDGTGYPNGLKKQNIHIFGRITALCDVFDALASKRCYKEPWQLDEILKLIKEEKAKQFDPVLVDLFLKNIDDFLTIKQKHED
ncbi:HD domain-containing phosphohydrolase, partial [Arcobacter sp. CECT 8985]|uniref:HD domain-containing phosphohydrolase n=1 Tax=Arcobacter sp. CECT 8985 TaxID=1935424 RepID=UPI00100A5DFC